MTTSIHSPYRQNLKGKFSQNYCSKKRCTFQLFVKIFFLRCSRVCFETPPGDKPEVKDSSVFLRFLIVPFLMLVVRDHLLKRKYNVHNVSQVFCEVSGIALTRKERKYLSCWPEERDVSFSPSMRGFTLCGQTFFSGLCGLTGKTSFGTKHTFHAKFHSSNETTALWSVDIYANTILVHFHTRVFLFPPLVANTCFSSGNNSFKNDGLLSITFTLFENYSICSHARGLLKYGIISSERFHFEQIVSRHHNCHRGVTDRNRLSSLQFWTPQKKIQAATTNVVLIIISCLF